MSVILTLPGKQFSLFFGSVGPIVGAYHGQRKRRHPVSSSRIRIHSDATPNYDALQSRPSVNVTDSFGRSLLDVIVYSEECLVPTLLLYLMPESRLQLGRKLHAIAFLRLKGTVFLVSHSKKTKLYWNTFAQSS